MSKFLTKGKLQKIMLVIVMVLLCNFITPQATQADLGGVLLSPFSALFTTIGDSILWALESWLTDKGTNAFEYTISDKDDKIENGKTLVDGNKNVYIKEEDLSTGGIGGRDGFLNTGIRSGDYEVPMGEYSPEMIFSNKVAALQINFISPTSQKNGDGVEKSTAYQLHSIVASWYVALRNLAIVGLLSVLMYIGIRILIASVSAEKAKYKQMLMDWVIALCLLFFLHYIMSFTIYLTEAITKMLAPQDGKGINVIVTNEGKNKDTDYDFAFNTNMAGYMRFCTQYESGAPKITYLILYITMVILTIMFTFVYLRRVIYMAFLTIIAPLVALTYPIDKISDGQAQAFNMWLKEYVFNALLQPFHLLLYTVLVGTALDLAVSNPIYALVAMWFILSAEKLLRKMFGFEKAATAGGLGAFAGGAIASSLMNKLTKGAAKGIGKASGKAGTDGASNGRIRTADDYKTLGDSFAEEGDGSGAGAVADASSLAIKDSIVTFGDNEGLTIGQPNKKQITDQYGNPIFSQSSNKLSEPEPTSTESTLPSKGSDKLVDQLRNKAQNNKWGRKALNTWNGKTGRTIRGVAHIAGKTLKPVGRGLVRGTSAVAGASFGLAAGIATGDASKVAQFAAAGAVAGSALGGRAMNTIENASGNIKGTIGAIKDTYNEGAYGPEEAWKKKNEREFMANKEYKKFIQSEFQNEDGSKLNRDQVKAYQKEMYKYTKAGITDKDEIKRGMQVLQGKNGYTAEQSVNILKSARQIKEDNLIDEKKRAQLQQHYAQRILKAGNSKGKDGKIKGTTVEQANKSAQRVINGIMIAKGLKD